MTKPPRFVQGGKKIESGGHLPRPQLVLKIASALNESDVSRGGLIEGRHQSNKIRPGASSILSNNITSVCGYRALSSPLANSPSSLKL